VRISSIEIMVLVLAHSLNACQDKRTNAENPKPSLISIKKEGEKKIPNALPTELRSIIEIVPDESIGPIKLGMKFTDLSSLGDVVRSEPANPSGVKVLNVGPIRAFVQNGVITYIEVVVGSGKFSVLGKTLPQSGSLEDISKYFPNCGPIIRGEGGNTILCGAEATRISRGSAHPDQIVIQVADVNKRTLLRYHPEEAAREEAPFNRN
jgi:hypothetical protein